MKIITILLIQLVKHMVSSSNCSEAASQFWDEFYKNVPAFTPADDNKVIIRWQTIIPLKMYSCVQLIELHEISVSSVSRPVQTILSRNLKQHFDIGVKNICTNSEQVFKIRFILVTNESLDSKPFQYKSLFSLSDRLSYCYQDRVLHIQFNKDNVQPCIYHTCYRGSSVQIKQQFRNMQKNNPDNDEGSGIASFVERVTKLVDIKLLFTNPEDITQSVEKHILMNITEGHCDDLEDGDKQDYIAALVLSFVALLLLCITVVILLIKRGKLRNENSDIIRKIDEKCENQKSPPI